MSEKKKKISFKKVLQTGNKKKKRKEKKDKIVRDKGTEKKIVKEVSAVEPEKKERIEELVKKVNTASFVPPEKEKIKLEKIEEVMGFEVNGELYCVPLNYVSEIMGLKPISAPDLPPYIIGLSEYRGEILPVLDPGVIFEIGEVQGEGSYIILHLDGVLVALKVSNILGIIKMKGKRIYPLPEGLQIEYLTGCIEFNQRVMAIMDPINLLRNEKLNKE